MNGIRDGNVGGRSKKRKHLHLVDHNHERSVEQNVCSVVLSHIWCSVKLAIYLNQFDSPYEENISHCSSYLVNDDPVAVTLFPSSG